MTPSRKPATLWRPSQALLRECNVAAYRRWLGETRGLEFTTWQELWHWSVTDLEAFWASIADYFEIGFTAPHEAVLSSHALPGARFFPGSKLNYAEHALRREGPASAVIYRAEGGVREELSWTELRAEVARARAGLRRLGVGVGDRVVAYIPNHPRALVAMLAAASLGAAWSSCPPEFGSATVLDRFRQIEPKLLFVGARYRYNGEIFNRRDEALEIVGALPTLRGVVSCDDGTELGGDSISWADLTSEDAPLAFDPLPFDHPLWILFSSGTTGLPKAIVHGHGGIVLEHVKQLALHTDLRPGDRFFWYSTTGWMMWSYLVSGLAVGATIVLYEGSPNHPDLEALFQLVEEEKITYFGTSAPFLMACRKAGIRPGERYDLAALRGIGSTGAPLPPEGFEWVYDAVKADLWLASLSGGTDVCSGFLSGTPLLPVRAGEIQTPSLGAKVEAWDEEGRSVVDEVGELVLTEPLPSMPVGFWNDPRGARYREAYFEHFPGVWRHGDWVKIDAEGRSIVYGRSDSTLNRGGVRTGTSEFYRILESVPGIADSLIVETGRFGRAGRLWLFLELADGTSYGAELEAAIATALETGLSPRHLPDEIRVVPEIPMTLTGKKLEVPVKRILNGTPIAEAANPGTLRSPRALEALVATVDTKVRVG